MGTFLSESSSRSALGVAAVTALLAGYRAVACDTHSISISTTTRSIRTTKTTHSIILQNAIRTMNRQIKNSNMG